MSDNRVYNPTTGMWEYHKGTNGAARTQGQPVVAFYEGTTGADIVLSAAATGVKLINDAAETILLTINSIAMKIKQNQDFEADFDAFSRIDIDPTTSLGTAQVETATLSTANVTVAGDCAVIITAAGMTGTPKTILVPVTTADTTPTAVMTKVRAAVAADTAVAALFTVGGTGADMTLTGTRGRANDATLNIDVGGTGTTATGITRAGTSANTTAGVAETTIGYRLWVKG